MSAVHRPDPPAGLGRAGKRAWRSAHAALPRDLRFTAKELELLRLVAGQSDTVAALEAEGRHKELGPARTALARLWTEVRVELDAADGLAPPVVNRRAQRAAQARWRAKQDLARERKALGGA
jgi:hypothetical protein